MIVQKVKSRAQRIGLRISQRYMNTHSRGRVQPAAKELHTRVRRDMTLAFEAMQ